MFCNHLSGFVEQSEKRTFGGLGGGKRLIETNLKLFAVRGARFGEF